MPNWQPNVPKMRNCFFCQEDKPCIVIQLPATTIEDLKQKHRDNQLMVAVIERVGAAYITRCEDCAGRQDWGGCIAEYMMSQYEIARRALMGSNLGEVAIDEAQDQGVS